MFEFYLDDKRKVQRVIDSCETRDQLDVAEKMATFLYKKWEIRGISYLFDKILWKRCDIYNQIKEVQLSFPFYWRLK